MIKLWEYQTTDWNDPIHKVLKRERANVFKKMYMIKSSLCPKSIKQENSIGKPDLVKFFEASKEVYCTVAHVRWQKTDANYEFRLVTSKNRIAPINIAVLSD